MKKKITALLLIAAFATLLVACGSRQETADATAESDTSASEQSETTETAEEADESEGTLEQTETAETAPAEETTEATETAETIEATETGSNTLVVYFSNTGNTKAIAEHIADGLSADIYEIIPEVPYTDADLDYGDDNSRSTQEMNDPSSRPAISGNVENMEQYDSVYIGYPIWWGEAPRILATFVESYDFTDKTVIPFCTSASSGVGSSASGLEALAGTGNWLDGQRFSGSESAEEVMEWVNGL